MRRWAAILAVALFGAVSFLVARWLTTDGVERGKVERLLEAQGRGDVDAMAREIDACYARCRDRLQRLSDRLKRPGQELTIARYDSDTSRALAQQLEHQEASVERFLELNGGDQPPAPS